MATEIKLPDLGDGIDSGDVLEVFVKVGDVIEKNADLIELETDKATVMVPASAAGRITSVHVAEGDTIAVGGVIVTVESASPAESPAPKEPAPEPAKKKRSEPESSNEAAEKTDTAAEIAVPKATKTTIQTHPRACAGCCFGG